MTPMEWAIEKLRELAQSGWAKSMAVCAIQLLTRDGGIPIAAVIGICGFVEDPEHAAPAVQAILQAALNRECELACQGRSATSDPVSLQRFGGG